MFGKRSVLFLLVLVTIAIVVAFVMPVAAQEPFVPEGYRRLTGAAVGLEIEQVSEISVTLSFKWVVTIPLEELLSGKAILCPEESVVEIENVETPKDLCCPFQRVTGYIVGLGFEPCPMSTPTPKPTATQTVVTPKYLWIKIDNGEIKDVREIEVRLYRNGQQIGKIFVDFCQYAKEGEWYRLAQPLPSAADSYEVWGDGRQQPWSRGYNLIEPSDGPAEKRRPIEEDGIRLSFSKEKGGEDRPWWMPPDRDIPVPTPTPRKPKWR